MRRSVAAAMWLVARLVARLAPGSDRALQAEAMCGDPLEGLADGRTVVWLWGEVLSLARVALIAIARRWIEPLLFAGVWGALYPAVWLLAMREPAGPRVAGLDVPFGTALAAACGVLPAVGVVAAGAAAYVAMRQDVALALTPRRVCGAVSVGVNVLLVSAMACAPRWRVRGAGPGEALQPAFTEAHLMGMSVVVAMSLFVTLLALDNRRLGPRRPVHVAAGRLICCVAIMGCLAGSRSVQAQAVAAPDAMPRLLGADGRAMEFEVVSVKANHSGAAGMNIASPPMSDGLTVTNMPPAVIVQWAFGIFLEDEIVGMPAWARDERYDISAKVSDADLAAFRRVSDPIQRTPMLEKILVDRFHLRFHYEMRELPVYALVVAKGGMRMTEIQPAIGPNGVKDGGGRRVRRGEIQSLGQPLKPLVNQLTQELRRQVVDRTGLSGNYNFTLKWTPEEGTTPADESSAPSIFTALQEQLGLKLVAAKAPVRVLVVDGMERPDGN